MNTVRSPPAHNSDRFDCCDNVLVGMQKVKRIGMHDKWGLMNNIPFHVAIMMSRASSLTKYQKILII